MTPERWRELESNIELKLTPEEIAEGWRFCCEFDGMLVNYNDTEGEGQYCTCRPK